MDLSNTRSRMSISWRLSLKKPCREKTLEVLGPRRRTMPRLESREKHGTLLWYTITASVWRPPTLQGWNRKKVQIIFFRDYCFTLGFGFLKHFICVHGFPQTPRILYEWYPPSKHMLWNWNCVTIRKTICFLIIIR